MKLVSMFKTWHNKPARWYQFWQPRSGFVGGAILTLLVYLIVLLLSCGSSL